ncbi:hypothetical protein BDV96DRAFT_649919 [Lophiotrema nucula]|uniref:Uncharacterized protein n=1 Tax=Lophiotrema nucula TaxID=690887 RepID=A0A6A5YWM9_9PLEO|nr:hypothetical protein BDV96DRAFT_649919 [Lophiotrema nucula]
MPPTQQPVPQLVKKFSPLHGQDDLASASELEEVAPDTSSSARTDTQKNDDTAIPIPEEAHIATGALTPQQYTSIREMREEVQSRLDLIIFNDGAYVDWHGDSAETVIPGKGLQNLLLSLHPESFDKAAVKKDKLHRLSNHLYMKLQDKGIQDPIAAECVMDILHRICEVSMEEMDFWEYADDGAEAEAQE